MDALTVPSNRTYLFAGAGAIIGLIAFLFMPFAQMQVKATGGAFSISLPAVGINTTLLASTNAAIWLAFLLVLLVLLALGRLIYSAQPLGKQVAAPVEKQVSWTLYAIIGAALLSIIVEIIVISAAKSISLGGALGSPAQIPGSFSFGVGAWIFLLAMLVVIGCAGWEAYKRLPKMPQQVAPGQSYPGAYPPPTGPIPPQYNTGNYPPQYNTGNQPPVQQYNTGNYPPQYNTGNQPPAQQYNTGNQPPMQQYNTGNQPPQYPYPPQPNQPPQGGQQ
ncbi:hypothetical protein EI42_03876 [Thermosporothrix hazakensis]|jgi:heme/copper-type cytochrome/quinol oxidase subunit 2|uniref:Uncharacterized protein n=2 Tax=Thermosporothrix TaxID=768650 RepID=A0A326UC92_THEHA|nr:hypothetical protein [Thermosporothrix hazakensis]PZW26296.1 hypothetical protein EI42_03876 [Thermosporothrix hazakensis]BBH90700.1 hypothetical protein KTC_54510 [Thermosporothrix sp. COM3]GCE48751.1 hypothetical protein KTH_36200 [Thermosporothrix hazakensis]